MNTQEEILVLDFGSQYNQLIARRIRDLGVYSELVSYDIDIEEQIKNKNIKGIILSGGPNSVYEKGSFMIDKKIFDLGLPILGICYGMQLITYLNNGIVSPCNKKEYGGKEIKVDNNSIIFNNTPTEQIVWMSHGDQVEKLPDGFKIIASSNSCPIAAIGNEERKIYGLQFHPEVNNSIYGKDLLANFIFKICNLSPSWSMEKYELEQIQSIKNIVKDKKVLLGISGGVDSTVAAVLIHKAIGDQLTCMFIDHGLLRKNEADIVMERFARHHINVIKIDASEKFLSLLSGVSEPEKKRKIIGHTFIEVFNEEALKIGHFDFLAQGTLYTDVIESGTKTAQTIKSHHNVGGLPKDMPFKLLEPLNKLFKDEVRKLGKVLGIDDELINRQPFPGPGLAIRIVGDITLEKLQIVRDSDLILREEFKKAGLDKTIWQYFTVLLNNKSVGVMGDQRTYLYSVAVRAVTSIDGMTADYAKIPYEILDIVSRRIVNEVKGVNRVLYDITSKPPSTIEFE